jgi:hypothetical protein
MGVFKEASLQLIDDPTQDGLVLPTGLMNLPLSEQEVAKCECGCAAIGLSKHSDYCPLYERNV